MIQPPIRRILANPLTITVMVFLASRVFFCLMGIRFDTDYIKYAWQAIDPVVLQNSPFESLWYLHTQPPVLNMLICAALHISTHHYAVILHAIFFLSGCGMSLSVCALLQMLGISKRYSVIITSLFIVSPSSILYENYLFYEHLVAVLLCTAALFLAKFFTTKKYAWGILFFGICSLVVLTRSMFHVVWLAAITVGLLLIISDRMWRKRVFFSAIVPFIICIGWYTKNAIIFGSFTSSTWLGFNMTRITVDKLSDSERGQLIANGTLTQVAVIPPFTPLADYPDEVKSPLREEIEKFPEADILRHELKSDRSPNFHYAGYIALSQMYKENAFRLIKQKPVFYIKQILNSSGIFFLSSANYFVFEKNRNTIKNYNNYFTLVLLGGLPDEWVAGLPAEKQLRICWWYVISLMCVCVWWAVQLFRRKLVVRSWSSERGVIMLFATFTIGYVFITSSLLEYGENNRFSYMIAPLVLIVVCQTIVSIRSNFLPVAFLRRARGRTANGNNISRF